MAYPYPYPYPGPPRRAAGLARYLLLAASLLTILYCFRSLAQSAAFGGAPTLIEVTPADLPAIPTLQNPPQTPVQPPPPDTPDFIADEQIITRPNPIPHPIDGLIEDAEQKFQDLLSKESHDINTAAAEYRRKRGRHPPPGFDTWFTFAQEQNAVMIEDFFDQIYHDLAPFWALAPSLLRREAWEHDMGIHIRNHTAETDSGWFWTQIWLDMLRTIEHLLPDMDIALNAMDEPRIAMKWEDVDQLMETEKGTKRIPPPTEVVSDFKSLSHQPDPEVSTRPKDWENTRPFWDIARRGCPPGSLAREAATMTDFNHTPSISLAHTLPHTYKGYVSNFSLSSDFCHQPDLQSIHGMMIEPLSVSSTQTLFPLFGGSKLATNNEILLPAPMYWGNEERYSGGDHHGAPWPEKTDNAVWRGVATGGRNRADNWKGFQRHRFVAMTNGSTVQAAENWEHVPENWAMPTSQFDLEAQQENKLGEWTGSLADTGFVDMNCEPPEEKNHTCSYTSPYFANVKGLTMVEMFRSKYLPDIDGNSFSGRYRGFLMSTSVPIKATIFREWHDSRLIPWKHFVPMDNRFLDFWGIMEYFVGFKGEKNTVEGHDHEAGKIALGGQEWANKVLRREDMQIYVLRLLLEYARVTDERRENMGWVGDLL